MIDLPFVSFSCSLKKCFWSLLWAKCESQCFPVQLLAGSADTPLWVLESPVSATLRLGLDSVTSAWLHELEPQGTCCYGAWGWKIGVRRVYWWFCCGDIGLGSQIRLVGDGKNPEGGVSLWRRPASHLDCDEFCCEPCLLEFSFLFINFHLKSQQLLYL